MSGPNVFTVLPAPESHEQAAALDRLAGDFGGEPWCLGVLPARNEYWADRDLPPVHIPVAVLVVRSQRDRSRREIPLTLGEIPVLTRIGLPRPEAA